MAKFLKTTDIRSALDGIIREADKQVTLISPFIRIPVPLFQSLKLANSHKVRIRLVYGKKKELDSDVRNQLEQLDNLSLAFLQNLHAKCFFNEKQALVTSLNLYDFSEQNVEMGILISAKDDTPLFRDVTEEAENICSPTLAEKVQLRSSAIEKVGKGIMKVGKLVSDSLTEDDSRTPSRTRTTSRTKREGYCIRCKTSIPYNLDSPYCRDCWGKWDKKGGNPDYKEPDGKCHACGRPFTVSKAKPLCDSCYDRSQR